MSLLSHYTDFRGLIGIIRSQSMWATEFRSLNDSSEMMYAFGKISRKAYLEFFDQIPADLKVGGLDPSLPEKCTKEFIPKFVELFANSNGYGSWYFTSFARGRTEDEDNRGILTLWDRYTKCHGYCIQFQSEKIADFLKYEVELHSYEFLDLVEVQYGLSENDPEFKFLVEQFRAQIQLFVANELGRYDFLPPENLLIPMEALARRLFKFCSTHKDEAFSDEREIRILASPSDKSISRIFRGPAFPRKLQNRGDAQRPIRYFSIFGDTVPGLLPSKILIGPKVDSTDQTLLFSLWLRPPQIVNSTIPVV